ncbi:uracil-DNA glycosylase [Rhodovibrionaceae bacterium A322]
MPYPHAITLDSSDAPLDCPLCPRLQDFRDSNQEKYPDYFNAPVPAFGPKDSRILILGLAPGLKGANCTGRPFTGDWAGDLLYATLSKFGLAEGTYDKRIDDGLTLKSIRITNAVRCVPPENKPTTQEIKSCQPFLEKELAGLPNLKAVIALGTIAHGALLTTKGLRKSHCKFVHGEIHELPDGLLLADSYHCSRYNTNTGRLTTEMFEAVFEGLLTRLG